MANEQRSEILGEMFILKKLIHFYIIPAGLNIINEQQLNVS